jgi:pantetheine-phosphate adenylyltransferase
MALDCGKLTSKPVTAIYSGSLDPVSNGHLHPITRASNLFYKLVVAVAHNLKKIL